jgi:hypothetical protein
MSMLYQTTLYGKIHIVSAAFIVCADADTASTNLNKLIAKTQGP